jgi:peptide/nickel transport system substrate-binding protein
VGERAGAAAWRPTRVGKMAGLMRGSTGGREHSCARLLAGALLIAVTLATPASAWTAQPGAKPKPRLGGTVSTALNLEPPSLNWYLGLGAPYSTGIVSDQVLASAYHDEGPAGRIVPSLAVGEPRVTAGVFSVTYRIRQQARWSDGVPITARDFVFTWQLLARSKFAIPSDTRELYDKITQAKIVSPKRVRFVFTELLPQWKDLFAPVLPQHALAGEDFDEVWRDRIDNPRTGSPLASGPFIFESWSRGSHLTLARNRNYWKRRAYLDRLDFRFLLPDFGAQIRAVRAGQVDLIQGLGNVPIDDLRSSPGTRVSSGSSFEFEHIDFQLGSKGNPALRKPFVRQAIAHGIDRKSLTDVLYKALTPGLKTDQSVIYLPFQPAYKPHWQRWSFRRPKAMRLLRAHGCRRGVDGIFSCQGQRLSFRFVSTAGSALRERTFEFIQPQLRKIGIDLLNVFGPRELVLNTVLPSGDWDLALFSWGYGGDPAALVDVWGCKGGHNLIGYCNPKVTALFRRAATELRTSNRPPLLNRADALMARDLPSLPLFVKPGYVIYNSRIRNVVWSPIDVLWNAQDWWIAPR